MREGYTKTVTESQHAPAVGRKRPGGEFGSLWALFGHPLDHFWLPLTHFWLPFGSLWVPFGSLLVSLGSLLVPFPSLLLTQGSIFSLLLYPVVIFRIFLNFP